ncbi:DoxX family protein [Nocardia aobensis]|uniref:DoxX family protein n=1 Tax=Nocardia aobensis TaxID=257277 RepID=UPI000566662B|nr:DoxX family protein [Nocardia aobensis]
MSIFLWSLQSVLAALIGLSGINKLVQPKASLDGKFPWMQTVSQGRIRFIGFVELIGAAGVIAPGATGVAPILTPIAAVGLMIFAVLAALLHIRRKEISGVLTVTVLFALAAVIAWGRFGPYGW